MAPGPVDSLMKSTETKTATVTGATPPFHPARPTATDSDHLLSRFGKNWPELPISLG